MRKHVKPLTVLAPASELQLYSDVKIHTDTLSANVHPEGLGEGKETIVIDTRPFQWWNDDFVTVYELHASTGE